MSGGTNEVYDSEAFRDSISTINEKGKREWIYPKQQKGKVFNLRYTIGYILLACLVSGPFLTWNGHPIFMFNVVARKFIVFGIPFFPQDFILFGLAMITFIVFITLFTAAVGRLWCGYACPQTIFMEMIFRRIEYIIEGDANERRRLDKAPWSAHKIGIKFSKHLIFYILSFLISNIFLAYIISAKELGHIITEGPITHFGGFVAILIFSGVFYFVFSFMREQICLIVCPYGRLQGVLLDKDSIVVAYDHVRGEPRGKLTEKSIHGDCIDCKLCVQVCPTGIDIRNGTQLECINCAACIDACDSIMDRIEKPKGLIRYASLNQIINKTKFKITPRLIAYAAVYIILLTTLVTAIVLRSDVEATILRTPGMLYQRNQDNDITNIYNFNLINKTFNDVPVELRLKNIQGNLKVVGNDIKVPGVGNYDGVLIITVPEDKVDHNKNKINIEVVSNNKVIDNIETTFFGPVHKKHIQP